MSTANAFNFDHIALPFRMQPGLRRMEPGERHLHPLHDGSPLWAEKFAVHQAGHALHGTPGFDATDAINSIAREDHSAPACGGFDSKGPLALQFCEDFAVLQADGSVPWLCVCAPSHWAPEEKVGLTLAQIHAPVADNATLLAATQAITRLVTSGASWERWVWTISPSNRYDQHPRRHARTPWPNAADAQAFAQACWLRSERQTFMPVHRAEGSLAAQAVFTIGVHLEPLTKAVNSPEKAQRLHGSLASMSDAVLAYKGLGVARVPLLRWLATQMG